MNTRRSISENEQTTLLRAACRQISMAMRRCGVDPCVIKVTPEELARVAVVLGGAAPQVPDNLMAGGVVFQLWTDNDDKGAA